MTLVFWEQHYLPMQDISFQTPSLLCTSLVLVNQMTDASVFLLYMYALPLLNVLLQVFYPNSFITYLSHCPLSL